MSETELLFKNYLNRIKEAYEQTDIKSSDWYYSLSSTPLYKNAVLLCGFNWGVGGEHEGQKEYPGKRFLDINDLGSFRRIIKPLENLLHDDLKEKIVQTNLCFFRSKSQKQIGKDDLAESVKIFKSLLKELQPIIFIGFSAKIKVLLSDCLDLIEPAIQIENGTRQINLHQGRLKEIYGAGKFFYIPHPNYPMTAAARSQAWETISF